MDNHELKRLLASLWPVALLKATAELVGWTMAQQVDGFTERAGAKPD